VAFEETTSMLAASSVPDEWAVVTGRKRRKKARLAALDEAMPSTKT
jgi:hypothetical protein